MAIDKDILKELLNDNTMDESHNIVSRLYKENDISSLIDGNEKIDLTEEFPLIPIQMIEPRPVNDYSKQRIKELADNIEKYGLLQPIIVYLNPNKDGKKYVISDGERRYRAVCMINEKFKNENNEEMAKKFSKIRAKILQANEEKHEQVIHRAANDLARDSSVFERVFRYYPKMDMFTDEKVKEDYVTLAYGTDGMDLLREQKIKVRFNTEDIYRYLHLMFTRDYPGVEVSFATVKKYAKAIMSSCDELKKAIMDTKIPSGYAPLISSYSHDTQRAIVNDILEGMEVAKAIEKETIINKDEEKVEEVKALTDDDLLLGAGKTFIKTKEKYEAIFDIKNKNLTGNQKEYLKQLKKIFKDIEILSKMPQK